MSLMVRRPVPQRPAKKDVADVEWFLNREIVPLLGDMLEGLNGLGELTVSVKEKRFGAKGDGATDDTAAIQAAVDYVGNQALGGRVIVPASSSYYRITDEITHKPHVTLDGLGGATIKQVTPRKAVLSLPSYSVECKTVGLRLIGAPGADVCRLSCDVVLFPGDTTLGAIYRAHFSRCVFDGGLVSRNQACSVDAATDTITAAAHGFHANDVVKFTMETTIAAPLDRHATYYVVNPTTNTFQVSATAGGAAIDLTTAGVGQQYVADVHGCVAIQPNQSDIYTPQFQDCEFTGQRGSVTSALFGIWSRQTPGSLGGAAVVSCQIFGGWFHWLRDGIYDNTGQQWHIFGVEFDSCSDRAAGGGGAYLRWLTPSTGHTAHVRFERQIAAADYLVDLGPTGDAVNGTYDHRVVAQCGGSTGSVARGRTGSVLGSDGSNNGNYEAAPTRYFQSLIDNEQLQRGDNVASATDMDLTPVGNHFVVTGTTPALRMSTQGWRVGAVVELHALDGFSLEPGQAPAAQYHPFSGQYNDAEIVIPAGQSVVLELIGGADFGGLLFWKERSRTHDWATASGGYIVASANTLTLSQVARTFFVSGATGLHHLTVGTWPVGVEITLLMTDGLTVSHNFAGPPAGTLPYYITGGADVAVAAGEAMTFKLFQGTGSVNSRWQEMGRSF